MRLSQTLTFYFGRHFLQALLVVYSGLTVVAFIFNTIVLALAINFAASTI